MAKDNSGEEIELRSLLELVTDSQPIPEPCNRPPWVMGDSNPYGVIGQKQKHLPVTPVAVPVLPLNPELAKDSSQPFRGQEAAATPEAPNRSYRLPVFGSIPPPPEPLLSSPELPSSNYAINGSGMLSPNPVTPSPTSTAAAENRQRPVTFPITPPSTVKYPHVAAPTRLSTIAECDTDDERTPPRGRAAGAMATLISCLTPATTPVATPIPKVANGQVVLEADRSVRVALFKEQVTRARLRREKVSKGNEGAAAE
ncbi:hypothetical protein ABEF93_008623 [Exophiala dermatitidis]